MIYAIPSHRDKIAPHFSEAEQFLILDDRKGRSISIDNPAKEITGCKGKKALLDMLIMNGVEAVVVRNIGERLLTKLLSCNVDIYQATRMSQLSSIHPSGLEKIMDCSAAKQSINHLNKVGCSEGRKTERIQAKILAPRLIGVVAKMLNFRKGEEGL